jgi:predicted RNase H-like HicB family nuclease
VFQPIDERVDDLAEVVRGDVGRHTAVVTREGDWYIARCVELSVTTQGRTLDEARANLQEAVELYLESFGTEELGESTTEVLLYPLEVGVNA